MSIKEEIMTRQLTLAAVLGIALSLSVQGAAAAKPPSDKPGGKDHPIVSRFQGAVLMNYGSNSYEEVEIPLGAYKSVEGKQDHVPIKSTVAKGKLWSYSYWGPVDRSDLEVFRNYQGALAKGGFKMLYVCDAPERCTRDNLWVLVEAWTQKTSTFSGGYDPMSYFNNAANHPVRFLAAQLARAEGDVYVTLTVQPQNSTTQDRGMGARYFMQVIESAPMATDQVKVDATAIRKGLASEGRVALYGILFDTDKAVLKAGSQSTLAEMAKALQADATARVYIVGHTDNQGAHDHNLALSRKRAEAVVEALQRQHGIAAPRLAAVGVADVSPLASNAGEAGRAKNRRVEMVLR
jgi:OOP family OmpA-OmpF porin